MKEARYFYVPEAPLTHELPKEEAVHALKVLRLKEGDELFVMNGKGVFYRAEVSLISAKKCLFEYKETLPQTKTWQGHIHLAIAPTKHNDRTEWLLEKATEIGFDEITLLNCRFSERKVVKIDRMEKIVVSAMKQSRKGWIPILNDITNFQDFIKAPIKGYKFIAHCYDDMPKINLFTVLQQLKTPLDITIMVGPEGDFSLDEVKLAQENGFQSLSLGNSRLRTETAGLMAVTQAQLFLSDNKE